MVGTRIGRGDACLPERAGMPLGRAPGLIEATAFVSRVYALLSGSIKINTSMSSLPVTRLM